MVLTKAEKEEVIKYLLETIFQQDPNSELHKTFTYNKIMSPITLIGQLDDWIDKLQYLEDPNKKTRTDLPKADAGLLKSFKAYMLYRAQSGNPITNKNWLSIITEEFDTSKSAMPTNQV